MDIIDTNNGSFSINAEMVINANKEFDVVNSFDIIDKTSNDMENGYEWLYFRNVKIDNLYFFINICFFLKKTKEITFSFSKTQIRNPSWDNWNENNELMKLKQFEEWLTKIIGGKRKFNWGEISSNYDSKGGSSSINIKYSN